MVRTIIIMCLLALCATTVVNTGENIQKVEAAERRRQANAVINDLTAGKFKDSATKELQAAKKTINDAIRFETGVPATNSILRTYQVAKKTIDDLIATKEKGIQQIVVQGKKEDTQTRWNSIVSGLGNKLNQLKNHLNSLYGQLNNIKGYIASLLTEKEQLTKEVYGTQGAPTRTQQ